MVKENIIPKTETVYEIKDKSEIPSFEEFIKTYENDGNLNYDDLNGGSIGEVEGYGPCKRYCGYNNPECNYYVSSGYAPLYMSCPSCSNSTRSLWLHSSCGGPMYISEYLRLECKDCYTGGHWREWQFACSQHNGYKYATSFASFNDAIKIALSIQAKNSGLRDLVKRISKKLIDEAE